MVRSAKLGLAAALMLSLSGGASFGDEDSRSVTKTLAGNASVIDGDTIEIHGKRIRLNGFDSPEAGSRCGTVNAYQAGSLALSDFIGTRTVECTLVGKTRDRHVGICSVGGKELGEFMVSEGWGRDWPRYSKGGYADEEKAARDAGAGIWGLECPTDLWGARNYE